MGDADRQGEMRGLSAVEGATAVVAAGRSGLSYAFTSHLLGVKLLAVPFSFVAGAAIVVCQFLEKRTAAGSEI